MADRRMIVVDPTMRSMRDGVRLSGLFNAGEADTRTMFVVNRAGEAGNIDLSAKDIHKVLQAHPVGAIPFLPKLLRNSAHHAIAAAGKGGRFSHAIANLARELSGNTQRRSWFFWRNS
jgi:Flp pilus assembly CpaE family ATPase